MNSQNSKKSNFPSNNSSHNSRNIRKKNMRMKNLSPAKKFRLRLRLEKFQKRWQSREEYFEHDTRENLHLKRNKKKRTKFNNINNDKSNNFKKSKRPAKLNTTNSNFLQISEKTPKTIKLTSKIDTIDSINSINSNSSLVTSREISQRIIQNTEDSKNNLSIYPTTSSDSMKCCCHCSCARSSSTKQRKPRRKLSSPYLGDFDILHINNNNHGNCPNAATKNHKLTVMTTQQQQHKYVEASSSSSDNFHQIIEAPRLVKFLAHSFVEKKNTSVKKRFKNGKRCPSS